MTEQCDISQSTPTKRCREKIIPEIETMVYATEFVMKLREEI